jgi:hypothetical protein
MNALKRVFTTGFGAGKKVSHSGNVSPGIWRLRRNSGSRPWTGKVYSAGNSFPVAGFTKQNKHKEE